MEGTRRCADCGYLSAKQNPSDPEFHHVGRQVRETGMPGKGLSGTPYCYRGVCEQGDDYDSNRKESDHGTAFVLTIRKERTCGKFIDYEYGRSPREHAEMEQLIHLKSDMDAQRAADKADTLEREAARDHRVWVRSLITSIIVTIIGLAFGAIVSQMNK